MNKLKLRKFENEIVKLYESKKIKSPIHLSGNNEDNLIRIFKKLKMIGSFLVGEIIIMHFYMEFLKKFKEQIINGRSMSVCSKKPKFYSSSIVGGTLSIAVGAALSNKINKKKDKVWVFIGDMTYETGAFYECHKYALQNNLNIFFVVEDNNMSTNTPTDSVWKNKKKKMRNVIKYKYKRKYPHHGIGKWILF